MKRKVVFIDTNWTNYKGFYYVDELVIKSKHLKYGDKVIAYQDDEEWDAEVLVVDDCWGVIIKSEARVISKERQEGHQEGYWEGCYVQRKILLQLLNELQASEELISKVKAWMQAV